MSWTAKIGAGGKKPMAPTIKPGGGGGIKPQIPGHKVGTGQAKGGIAPWQPTPASGRPAKPAPVKATGSGDTLKRAVMPTGKTPTSIKTTIPSKTAAASASGSSAAGKKPVFTVKTHSKDKSLGTDTLCGDFAEVSTNHTKKVYQKVQAIPGYPDVKVFLYYWDQRDGADFSGWWIGDEVGGTNVWARCVSNANIPPQMGWKVPWDSLKPEPGVLLVSPYSGGAAAATPSAAPGSKAIGASGTIPAGVAASGKPVAAGQASSVKQTTLIVEGVEQSVKAAVARAKTMKEGSDRGSLRIVEMQLTSMQKKVSDAQSQVIKAVSEARKDGPSGQQAVTQLSSLSPKLRTASASIAPELSKLKGWIAAASPAGAPTASSKLIPAAGASKVKQEIPAKKPALSEEEKQKLAEKKKEDEEKRKEEQKKKEEQNKKEFEELLPKLKDAVSETVEAVEAIAAMAAPLLEDPDGGNDTVKDDIENAATSAQKKLGEVRDQVNKGLQAARAYAPETRKTALAEITSLQQQLGEMQKKTLPFKTFKKDFAQRIEAKKSLADIAKKLDETELEVEKASMMSVGSEQGSQMSEDDIKAAEEIVRPAQKSVADVKGILETKLRAATGPAKDELSNMKDQLAESVKKIDKIVASLKSQKEGLQLQEVFETAREKVDKAEASLAKCSDAELPFLKGLEVLPDEESAAAINACEAAAVELTGLSQQAKSYIAQKLTEVRKYSKETVKNATEELKDLQKRSDEVAQRLSTFKAETQERKITSLMVEAHERVVAAETKLKTLTDATKPFADGHLDSVTIEALKEASEKTEEAEKECSAALDEARKVVSTKQKDAKDNDLKQGLMKLVSRLNIVQQEIGKAKQAAGAGKQLIKAKEVGTEAEAKLADIETEVERLKKLAKPEDEGLGIESVSDESVLEIEEKGVTAAKSLKEVVAALQQNTSTSPGIKAVFAKLLERTKQAQGKIEEAKGGTKEQRERVLGASYAKASAEKAEAVEAALESIAAAEAPYLKGIEVLPLEESKSSLAVADETIANIQAVIAAARSFIAGKNVELKKFDAEKAKPNIEEMAKCTERVNAGATKLGAFKKDTELRKKKAQLQESVEQIKALEAEAEKVSEAMKPIMEKNADELSPEEASSLIKNLEDLEKSAKTKEMECRTALQARLRDAKGDADSVKMVQELSEKVNAVASELTKAKKLSSTQNQKLVAKALIQEAGEKAKGLQDEIDKAAQECAPLVEEKGERFLVKASIVTMCAALTKHMEENELNDEAMCNKMGAPLNQESFVNFLAKIPEDWKREECSFSEERRIAMFKSIDADADGVISAAEFRAMMLSRYMCVHTISMTDIFEIAKSKTIRKLEVGEFVEGYGEAKVATGEVARLKIKVVSSGEEGWVTLKGNNGTTYLDPVTPIGEFTKQLDSKLTEFAKSNQKVSQFFSMKSRELQAVQKDSAMWPAKEEVTTLRAKVQELLGKFEALKKKVAQAKSEYPALEAKEKNAHIVARERREADEILAPAKPAVDAVEAELAKIEEAAKPLTERQGTDLLSAFGTPVSVQDAVKAIEATLKASADEGKTKVKQQQEIVADAKEGAKLEAKKDLQKLLQKLTRAEAACGKVLMTVKSCCNTIAVEQLKLVCTAVRGDVTSQGTSLEDLYAKLAGADGERISEEAFAAHIQGIKDINLPSEQLKLLTQHIEVGGIGRRNFMRTFQQYFKIVQSITITPSFDVGAKEKPVRKAEVNEIVEVIEGPKADSNSLERFRVRAVTDAAVGWITLKGNQGKTFMEPHAKPFYACTKESPLDRELKTDPDNAVRMVKVDEVLEILEGPRVETLASVSRVRCKASKDGKTGWFTLKDQNGAVSAEKSGNVYTCTAVVAITDAFDVKDCKVVRKMEIDEVFTVVEGPVKEEGAGVTRVKGKCSKDDIEGWITLQGNAGTTYAKVNEKLYTIQKDVALQQKFASASDSVRTLEAGETIELQEGPKEEKFPPAQKMKVRASGDRAVGWMSINGTVKPWSAHYKCSKASPLYAVKGSKDSEVREIKQGESLELLEGPVDVAGVLWMKAKSKKDGAIGWTTFCNAEGERILAQA